MEKKLAKGLASGCQLARQASMLKTKIFFHKKADNGFVLRLQRINKCRYLMEVDITPPTPLKGIIDRNTYFEGVYRFKVKNCPCYDIYKMATIIEKCNKYKKDLKDLEKTLVELKN